MEPRRKTKLELKVWIRAADYPLVDDRLNVAMQAALGDEYIGHDIMLEVYSGYERHRARVLLKRSGFVRSEMEGGGFWEDRGRWIGLATVEHPAHHVFAQRVSHARAAARAGEKPRGEPYWVDIAREKNPEWRFNG